MTSPNHTPPSPSISDVMDLLNAIKKQNDEGMKEILTIKKQNDEAMKEILTKLTCLEEDNRKLKQELQDIKSSHNHGNNLSSKKRDEPEDDSEHRNEQSDNKKPRVTVSSLPPEPELPASFDTLDDDCLGDVLEFVGKKCYSAFGRVNKRCNEMFCSKGLRKETYIFGYAPLRLIQQQPIEAGYDEGGYSKAVLHYNRRDVLEWILAGGTNINHLVLDIICRNAIEKSRLGILREVFQRANGRQMRRLRDCGTGIDLCAIAAGRGELEILKLSRENGCKWDHWTWYRAKEEGHDHILQYLRDNRFPTEYKAVSLSECEFIDRESEDSDY